MAVGRAFSGPRARLALVVLGLLVFAWWAVDRWRSPPVEYWFRRYVRAGDREDPEARARDEEAATAKLMELGTNAVPFLLREAFSPPEKPGLRSTLRDLLRWLPASLQPHFRDAEDIRNHAARVVMRIQPPADRVFPALLPHLTGTNVDYHLRAVWILASAGLGRELAVPYLVRDLGHPDAMVHGTALQELGALGPAAQGAVPGLVAQMNSIGPNGAGYDSYLGVLRKIGTTAADGAPALEQALTVVTNSWTRCQLLQTLGTIKPGCVRTAWFLTNYWETLSVLTNRWETESQPDERERLRSSLEALLGTNFTKRIWIPVLPSSRPWKPTPERWLELGKDDAAVRLGPSVAEWVARAQGQQPEYQGRPLKVWLERVFPLGLPLSEIPSVRAAAKTAVQAIGTNALPWAVRWLQEGGAHDGDLAYRAFIVLPKDQTRSALGALVELTRAPDESIRARAYLCLGHTDPSWAQLWPAIIPLLHQSDDRIRGQAAAYLLFRYPEESRRVGITDLLPPFRDDLTVRIPPGFTPSFNSN